MEDILFEASQIVEADTEIQEKRRLRGEKFNVFTELGLYHHEVRLHSRMINARLNAQGNHGQKDAFLKEFICIIGIEDLNFDTANSSSTVELYIGEINDDKTEGGQIDLVVTSGDKAIIIENKINAGDQENQLQRYHNYAKEKYKGGFKLIYLNKLGAAPDERSLNGLTQDDYLPITYQYHIDKWLKKCLDIAHDISLVRETIVQYKEIVDHLTNNVMDSEEQKNMIELISKNLVTAEQIANSLHRAKNQIQEEIKGAIYQLLKDRLGEGYEVTNSDNPKYSQIWIGIRGNSVPAHIFFGVECFTGYSDLFVGVFDNKREDNLDDSLTFPKAERSNNWWVNLVWIQDSVGATFNFGNALFLEKLHNDSQYKSHVIEYIVQFAADRIHKKAPQLIDYFDRCGNRSLA